MPAALPTTPPAVPSARTEGASTPVAILCVDDEQAVLDGVALHLRRRYQVLTSTSGAGALDVLRSQPTIAVIVSDMRMPGMDGAAFLAKARDVAPDAVRILLTGDADIAAAVSAVNDGQLFRFLLKPCPTPNLASAVEAAAAQHRLITAERVLLEETLHGSIKALADVLALTNPVAFGRAMRVKQHVSELAVKLEIRDRWQVEVAAMLAQIGSIALPTATTEKVFYGRPLTPGEQAMVERAPAVAEQLLASIPRLEAVRGIIAALHRTKPAPRSNATDPLHASVTAGAEILRIATDFETLEAEGNTSALALDTMLGRRGRYNPAMLRAFESIRDVHQGRDEVREVALSDLSVGMVLAEDVRLVAGTLLASRGYEVTASFVERARNFRDAVSKKSLRVVMPGGGAA